MTESEKERVRTIEQMLSPFLSDLLGDAADGLPEDAHAMMLGVPLAAVDAWFAIRDGEEWRGMSDPKEIAARMLRDMNLSDEAHQSDE